MATEVAVTVSERNVKKYLNDIAYIEVSADGKVFDYCLGSDLKECGNICRQILSAKTGREIVLPQGKDFNSRHRKKKKSAIG